MILEVDRSCFDNLPSKEGVGLVVLLNPTVERIQQEIPRNVVLPVYAVWEDVPKELPESPYILKPMLSRFDSIFYYRLTGLCEALFQ